MWELQLEHVNQQLADTDINLNEKQRQLLVQRQRELRKNVALYETHLKQYETCRKEIKRVEQNLVYGDGKCVLYRDFVNCYNERGGKVKNLVLVKVLAAKMAI